MKCQNCNKCKATARRTDLCPEGPAIQHLLCRRCVIQYDKYRDLTHKIFIYPLAAMGIVITISAFWIFARIIWLSFN